MRVQVCQRTPSKDTNDMLDKLIDDSGFTGIGLIVALSIVFILSITIPILLIGGFANVCAG